MSRTRHSDFLDGMDDLKERTRTDRDAARFDSEDRYERTSLRRFNVPASGVRSVRGVR